MLWRRAKTTNFFFYHYFITHNTFSQCRKQPCAVLSLVLTKVIRLQEKTILGSKPITDEIHGKSSLNSVGPKMTPNLSPPCCSSVGCAIRILIAAGSIPQARGFLLCFHSQSLHSSCWGQQVMTWGVTYMWHTHAHFSSFHCVLLWSRHLTPH